MQLSHYTIDMKFPIDNGISKRETRLRIDAAKLLVKRACHEILSRHGKLQTTESRRIMNKIDKWNGLNASENPLIIVIGSYELKLTATFRL